MTQLSVTALPEAEPAPVTITPTTEQPYEVTAKGRYFVVYRDGARLTQHTTEREALQQAIAEADAWPDSVVKYVHEYEVSVSRLRRRLPTTFSAVGATAGSASSSVRGSAVLRGAGAAAGSASPAAVGQAVTSGWLVGNQTFTIGTAASVPLSPPSGEGAPFTSVGTTFPSGVSISGSNLVWSGSGTAGATTGHIIASSTTAEQDWINRSTAAGVFYSNNFTYKNAAKTLLIASDADLHSTSYQINAGELSTLKWEPTIKLSGGGSCRFNMPASIPGRSNGYHITWDGIGLTTKNTSKHEFYVQFALYTDSIYRDFIFGTSATWGGKIAIIQAPDRSFEPSEIVIRRSARGRFFHGYRFENTGAGTQAFYGYNADTGQFIETNFIDRGTPAITGTLAEKIVALKRRHGMTGTGNLDDPDYQHVPHMQANGWAVVEVYIKQVASGPDSIVKVWIAPYGQAPQLVMGAMQANLAVIGTQDQGSAPKPIYTGMQLTNYHNTATNWPTQDTFICYDEIIASNNPIPFPGGYSIPYPGSALPVGEGGDVHPYAALVDN